MGSFETSARQHNVAWLTLNRSCNFRCPWCYAQGTGFDPKKSLTYDFAVILLNIITALRVKLIILIGGEPTLWPDLILFNRLLKTKDIQSVIVTNAYRFGNNTFWTAYNEVPNDGVNISLKAWDAASMKSIIGNADFEILKRGISRGLEYSGGSLSFVVSEQCLDHLVEMAGLAKSLGAQRLNLTMCEPYIVNGETEAQGLVSTQRLNERFVPAFAHVRKLMHENVSVSLKTPLCLWPRDFLQGLIDRKQLVTGCQLQHRSGLIFDYDGAVSVCNGLTDYPVARYETDYQSAPELQRKLESEEVVQLYDTMTSYPSTRCNGCPMWENCGGGCPLFWTLYKPEEVIPGW